MDQKKLYKKAIKATDIFPYMTFRIQDGPKAFLASIDRIDCSKGYTEKNVVVVPMWLNSAKLDLSWVEIRDIMFTHLECEDLEEIYT